MYSKLWLVDSTLRDGEQEPNVVFTKEEKLKIVEYLAELGVQEIELLVSGITDYQKEDIQEIISRNYDIRMTGWCRANENDIKICKNLKFDAIHISFPVSDIILKTLNKTKIWVITKLKELVKIAKENFQYVSVGGIDSSRAYSDFLDEFLNECYVFGVNRFRYADTIGILYPMKVANIISSIKAKYNKMEIDFHAHNDLGMATANAVTAFLSGADSISATINGIGERAGNASLEEVIFALEKSKSLFYNYNTKIIKEMCEYVAKITKETISVRKPIIGSNIFLHESGIHCRSMLSDRNSYEIIHPEDVGEENKNFVIGIHSGKSTIKTFLKKNNIICNDEKLLDQIVNKVKETSYILKSSISEEVLLRIVKSIIK